MRVAHFAHRYPPALGGSEAYFARLGRFLAARGHEVVVFTTTALDHVARQSPAVSFMAGTAEILGQARKAPIEEGEERPERFSLPAVRGGGNQDEMALSIIG